MRWVGWEPMNPAAPVTRIFFINYVVRGIARSTQGEEHHEQDGVRGNLQVEVHPGVNEDRVTPMMQAKDMPRISES
jgi:hypothetical protein